MRSHSPVEPLMREYPPSHTSLLPAGTAVPSASFNERHPMLRSRLPSGGSRDAGDTGVEFLSLYRRLLADIECWCKPTGAPITQVIRRQALRDYVEVYCHTYPRQPSYPFPPRFGRYLAYLEGFDEIVEAINGWCEWLSLQFLPGVVPIHLIRSALDEGDEARPAGEPPYPHSSIHAAFGLMAGLHERI